MFASWSMELRKQLVVHEPSRPQPSEQRSSPDARAATEETLVCKHVAV